MMQKRRCPFCITAFDAEGAFTLTGMTATLAGLPGQRDDFFRRVFHARSGDEA
jgi:hypothetical protein